MPFNEWKKKLHGYSERILLVLQSPDFRAERIQDLQRRIQDVSDMQLEFSIH